MIDVARNAQTDSVAERGITMSSRNKILIIGGLVGSALGILAAWLYAQAAREEEEATSPQPVPPGKMVRLGLSVMEVLRQVAALGVGEEEGQKRGKLRKR
jgi:hypothetical protein